MRHFFKLTLLILFLFSIFSCDFFSSPEGNAEIISVYTTNYEKYHYLTVTLKISNIGNKDIYSSTISLKADSSVKTYYKTQTCSTVIKPDTSIYYSIEFQFEDEEDEEDEEKDDTNNTTETTKSKNTNEEKEKWIEDSVKILEQFWN